MSVDFELRMIDSVAGPANRAAAALKKTEDNARKAQDALSFDKQASKAEGAIKKLAADPAGFQRLVRLQKDLADQRSKLKADAGGGKSESLGSALKEKLGFGRLVGAAAAGTLIGEGIMAGAHVLLDAAHSFIDIVTSGFKSAVREGAKEQVLRLGFGLSLGAKEGGKSFGDIGGFSKRTGFIDDEIAKMMLPLRRAGMSQLQARSAFAASADVAAGEGRGGDAGRVGELMELFKKVQLKGGVSEKMLVGLGVEVKPFFETLAKELHIGGKAGSAKTGEGATAAWEEAKKKATEGKVDPQRLLNLVYEGIEKRQGGKLGTGAIAYSKTMESRLKKLETLPGEFLETLAESDGFKRLSDTLGALFEKLDPDGPQGQRIVAALERTFNKITGMLGGPESAFDDIADGIANTIDLMADLIPDIAYMGKLLLDAAGAVAEMVNGIRLYVAIKSGDTAGAQKIVEDQMRSDQRRARQDEEVVGRAYGREHPSQVEVAPGPWMDGAAPRVTTANGRHTTLTAPLTLHYHAAPGEDGSQAAHKMGVETHRHTSNALERAAQESGARQ